MYLYHDLHPGLWPKGGALQGNSLLIRVLLQDRHSHRVTGRQTIIHLLSLVYGVEL